MADMDKENRPPPGMMGRNGGRSIAGRKTGGRKRMKASQAQYFDVGKVGRKTGLTLPDKGIRDEHGLEPVSGIFSSPIASPQKGPNATLSSDEMQVQDSSAPDVDATLHSRKTPKLPPPRASTPKHTHIGGSPRRSPGRHYQRTTGNATVPLSDDEEASPGRTALSGPQPPANRMLDFVGDGGVRKSIESLSPFKPKKQIRRSNFGVRADPFASPAERLRSRGCASVVLPAPEEVEEEKEQEPDVELGAYTHDAPLMLDHRHDGYTGGAYTDNVDADETQTGIYTTFATTTTKSAARPRSSGSASAVSHRPQTPSIAASTPTRKRDRTSLEEVDDVVEELLQTELDTTGVTAAPAQKKARATRSPNRTPTVHHDDEQIETIDPTLLAHGNEYMPVVGDDDDREPSRAPSAVQASPPQQQEKPRFKGKGKAKVAPPKERAAKAKPMRATTSPTKKQDGPSRATASPRKRGTSMGPVSNVNLRATTPFEDAITTSRFGRAVIKPLQYWANESRVWKHGECEGIIRAESVDTSRPAKPKKRGRKRKTTNGVSKLEDIEEESEPESVLPDEWEAYAGIIAGTVASWNSQTQMGEAMELVKEDLAFAASGIVTKTVAGSGFRYAKIMTLPFFGTGVVDLPPEGFKRARNSKKMQMCFFVHEGKVIVDIGAQGSSDVEVNQFALSKGGSWVVPRGNNYAIVNESRTKTARIFFAQGCEIHTGANATE